MHDGSGAFDEVDKFAPGKRALSSLSKTQMRRYLSSYRVSKFPAAALAHSSPISRPSSSHSCRVSLALSIIRLLRTLRDKWNSSKLCQITLGVDSPQFARNATNVRFALLKNFSSSFSFFIFVRDFSLFPILCKSFFFQEETEYNIKKCTLPRAISSFSLLSQDSLKIFLQFIRSS